MVCPFLEKCPKASLFYPRCPRQFISKPVRTPFPIEMLILLLLGLLLLFLPMVMAPSEPKIVFIRNNLDPLEELSTLENPPSLDPTKENVEE